MGPQTALAQRIHAGAGKSCRKKRAAQRQSPCYTGDMDSLFLTLFDTALGRCGIAWGEDGIVAVSFPEENDEKTRARLRRRARSAEEVSTSPESVNKVIADIKALFEGALKDLAYARLDLTEISDFDKSVFDLSLAIKPGETKTYGELARALGDVSLSRRVGQALGRNPFPIIVPCHRIVGADGAMTGFSAPGGTAIKRRLLKIEGALEPDLFDAINC